MHYGTRAQKCKSSQFFWTDRSVILVFGRSDREERNRRLKARRACVKWMEAGRIPQTESEPGPRPPAPMIWWRVGRETRLGRPPVLDGTGSWSKCSPGQAVRPGRQRPACPQTRTGGMADARPFCLGRGRTLGRPDGRRAGVDPTVDREAARRHVLPFVPSPGITEPTRAAGLLCAWAFRSISHEMSGTLGACWSRAGCAHDPEGSGRAGADV